VLVTPLFLLATLATALAGDPLAFDFMGDGDAAPAEALPTAAPLPDDAPPAQRIWHAVSASQPCSDDAFAACAGEALALFSDAQRRAVYVRVAPEAPGPLEEDIAQIEQAAGRSTADAAEMASSVVDWLAAYDALQAERAALLDELGTELRRAEALLSQLGQPEDAGLRLKVSLLADELLAYQAQFDVPAGAAPAAAAGHPRAQVDACIERLSVLAFDIRTRDSALAQMAPHR